MKGLIITGSILLFLMILMIAPVVLSVRIWEKNTVSVRYLFFRYMLYPKKKKKKKSDKKEKDKEASSEKGASKEKKKEKAESTAMDTIQTILDLAEASKSPLFHLLRRTYLVHLDLRIDVGGEDAAEVALNTAKYRAAVGYFIGLFRSLKLLKFMHHAAIRPNFLREDTDYKVKFCIMMRLGTILYALLVIGIKYIMGQVNKPPDDFTPYREYKEKKEYPEKKESPPAKEAPLSPVEEEYPAYPEEAENTITEAQEQAL